VLGSGGIAPAFLTSALVSHPGFFIVEGKGPGAYVIVGWVGPGVDLNIVQNRKLLPFPGLEQLVLILPQSVKADCVGKFMCVVASV
jgi:hypothetical protein